MATRSRDMAAKRWFAQGALARTASLRGFAGVDTTLTDLGADAAERAANVTRLAASSLQLVLRLSTGNGGNDAPADHVRRLEGMLEEASHFEAALTHVVINADESNRPAWSATETLEYFHGALPLGAAFLEQAPWAGASTRETDVFGGRPTHLHGVSHGAMGPQELPHLLDVYPIIRLSADISHWGEAPSEEVIEDMVPHVDHLTLTVCTCADRSGLQLLGSTDAHRSLWGAVAKRKAARGANELLCSVSHAALGPGESVTRAELEALVWDHE